MRIPRRWLLVPLILYWVGIFVATHISAVRLPQTHISDKTEHFVAYFLLTLLLCNEFSLHSRMVRGDWVVLCIVGLYGFADEWTQQYVGRGTDLMDWYADMGGAAMGVACWGAIQWAVQTVRSRRRIHFMNEIATSECNVDKKVDASVR